VNYIIYNKTGEILRTVSCSPAMSKIQAKEGEFILEGAANDVTQKIIAGEVVDKLPEEIEEQNPILPKMPFEKQLAGITNAQWQDVQDRLNKLENHSIRIDK